METEIYMYSKSAFKVIKKYIYENYPEDYAWQILEKFKDKYLLFAQEVPFMGGKKNTQSTGVYDTIAVFALYEVLPKKLTLEEVAKINDDIFVPAYERISFVNLNNKFAIKAANKIFLNISLKNKKHEKDWPGNYIMEVEPFDEIMGIRYKFHFCPIADFAKKHGLVDIMPAICNADYPMLEKIHANLIRKKTCALDEYCDYQIVASENEIIKKHPRYTDEKGYFRNK